MADLTTPPIGSTTAWIQAFTDLVNRANLHTDQIAELLAQLATLDPPWSPTSAPTPLASLNAVEATTTDNQLYQLTHGTPYTAFADNMWFLVRFPSANAGDVNLKIDSLPPKDLLIDGAQIAPDGLTANRAYLVVYDSLNDRFDLQDVALNALPVEASPDLGADYAMIYKTSASALRKVLLQNIGMIYTESPNIALVDESDHTFAHGLGGTPKLVQLIIECQTADRGYTPGDLVVLEPSVNDSGDNCYTTRVTSTTVVMRYGKQLMVRNKDSTSSGGIIEANWRLRIRAWR